MTLTNQLDTLESSGLIHLVQFEPELEYLFRHVLVQEAAYSSLVKADRRVLHLVVGEVLERAYPQRLDELAPLLAEHYAEAEDHCRALEYYTRAGDVAMRVYATAEAIMHYTRALDAAGSCKADSQQLIHLYTRRGRALELRGEYGDALANYDELEGLAQEQDDRALALAALIARATVYAAPTTRQDSAQAKVLAEEALTLACELGDRPAESKILWTLTMANGFTGRFDLAVSYGEQSLAIARELNLREQMAYTLNDLANFGYVDTGQMALARTALAEAASLWRELGNLPMLTDSLNNSGYLSYLTGDLEQAMTLLQEAHRISLTINNPWGLAFSDGVMGVVHLERGEWDKAIEMLSEAVRRAKLGGFSGGVVIDASYLALTYASLGAVTLAEEPARVATQTSLELSPAWKVIAAACVTYLRVLTGALDEAEMLVTEMRAAMSKGLLFSYTLFILAEGELGLAQKNYAPMVNAMDHLLERIHHAGFRVCAVEAQYYKAKALMAQGQIESARELLIQARIESETIGLRRLLWPILSALSEVEAQRGNPTEAEGLREQARAITAFIAEQCPPALRESFLNLPQVRALFQTSLSH